MFFLWFVDWQFHRFLLTSSGSFLPSFPHSSASRGLVEQCDSSGSPDRRAVVESRPEPEPARSRVVFLSACRSRGTLTDLLSAELILLTFSPFVLLALCVCVCLCICSAYLTSLCDICIGLCDYGSEDINDLIVSSVWQLSCFEVLWRLKKSPVSSTSSVFLQLFLSYLTNAGRDVF